MSDLVLDNMGLVHYIATDKIGRNQNSSDYEDLVQEGMVGLVLASKRYDESTGIKFCTFASRYIEGYMRTFIRKNKTMKHTIEAINIVKDIELIEEIGVDEYIRRTDVKRESVNELYNMQCSSLDFMIYDEKTRHEMPIMDTIKDENNNIENYISETNAKDILKLVSECIEEFPYKEREIYRSYIYSKLGDKKTTQIEISNNIKCSQSYVSRIIRKGNIKLTRMLKKEGYL